MIESMCVVCHGPVKLNGRTTTAIYCYDNEGLCSSMWRRMKRGALPAPKYASLRVMHAFRRELMALEIRLATKLHADGWLEVG